MFNERLFSKGFYKVGDLFKFVCFDPRITELQLKYGIFNLFTSRACTTPCRPNGKKMTSNKSEVLLKTVPFNGVVYSNAEVLCSKKDSRSPYIRNIKTTYSEKEL